jgi:hypothetical protein
MQGLVMRALGPKATPAVFSRWLPTGEYFFNNLLSFSYNIFGAGENFRGTGVK